MEKKRNREAVGFKMPHEARVYRWAPYKRSHGHAQGQLPFMRLSPQRS